MHLLCRLRRREAPRSASLGIGVLGVGKVKDHCSTRPWWPNASRRHISKGLGRWFQIVLYKPRKAWTTLHCRSVGSFSLLWTFPCVLMCWERIWARKPPHMSIYASGPGRHALIMLTLKNVGRDSQAAGDLTWPQLALYESVWAPLVWTFSAIQQLLCEIFETTISWPFVAAVILEKNRMR